MLETVTKKIYFLKYGHRLVVKVRNGNHNASRQTPTGDTVAWLLDREYKGQYRSVSSYSWEEKQQKFTVFFKDPELLDYLKKTIGEEFLLEHERPLDDAHLNMLLNEKVITRKSLFYDKYRIAIRVKCGWGDKDYKEKRKTIGQMIKWSESQFGTNFRNDRWLCTDWTNANFYFRDPQDAVLFKLSHQLKSTTERVVLLSEINKTEEV